METIFYSENDACRRSFYHGIIDKNGHYIYGILQWTNGSIFIGNFSNDMRQGLALCIRPGIKSSYYGYFKDDYKHGAGRLYYGNCKSKYIGEFYKGLRNGAGTLYASDGTIKHKGIWRKGEIINEQN